MTSSALERPDSARQDGQQADDQAERAHAPSIVRHLRGVIWAVLRHRKGCVYSRRVGPHEGGASSLSLPFHHVQPSAHGVAARPVAGAHQRRTTPDVVINCQGGSRVAYTDQVLTCADCGIDFVFSASEQEFFAQKGFTSAPKRCPSCRAQRRATGGGGSYGNGGSYGERRRVLQPRAPRDVRRGLRALRQGHPGALPADRCAPGLLQRLLPPDARLALRRRTGIRRQPSRRSRGRLASLAQSRRPRLPCRPGEPCRV